MDTTGHGLYEYQKFPANIRELVDTNGFGHEECFIIVAGHGYHEVLIAMDFSGCMVVGDHKEVLDEVLGLLPKKGGTLKQCIGFMNLNECVGYVSHPCKPATLDNCIAVPLMDQVRLAELRHEGKHQFSWGSFPAPVLWTPPVISGNAREACHPAALLDL